jgi:urease accessory protein
MPPDAPAGTARPVAGLLKFLQFGDSVLPVGAFSFSNGLESAIQQQIVTDRESLREFIEVAAEQAAFVDGIALLAAYRAARAGDFPAVCRADAAVYNRRLNEEQRTMTIRMGRKLAELSVHIGSAPLVGEWIEAIRQGATPGTYPVAQGIAFANMGLSETEAFAAHQYGVVSMMLGAALRLMKLHYLDSQSILFAINARADALYERIADSTLDDMSAFSPLTDILAAVHVRSHVRIFMN